MKKLIIGLISLVFINGCGSYSEKQKFDFIYNKVKFSLEVIESFYFPNSDAISVRIKIKNEDNIDLQSFYFNTFKLIDDRENEYRFELYLSSIPDIGYDNYISFKPGEATTVLLTYENVTEDKYKNLKFYWICSSNKSSSFKVKLNPNLISK